MPNGSGDLARVRNYLYQGKKIDKQVHLGYDLSSTQHADLVKPGQSMVRAAPPARREAIAFISACSSREEIQIDPRE